MSGKVVLGPRKERRSLEEIFRVSPDPKILLGRIEDDYRLVKRSPDKKISPLTLKWLKEKGYIKHEYYFLYSQVSERPEERTLIPERSVIEIINAKLVHLYESC